VTCKPCTYSQEPEADYLQTSSSGTRQLSLLSGTDTAAKFSANEPQMDGSPTCKCGKGMSGCSTHPNTRDEWIASMRGSLAKTLASLESRWAYLKEPDQVFTEKSCVLLTSLDPNTSTWRMLQQSFLTDSEPYLETWPRVGMTQGGYAYAHPMSERRITETDGGCWPTPTTMRGGENPAPSHFNGKHGWNLGAAVKVWPTPTAHNAKETNAPSEAERNTPTLAAQVGGKLNPMWVEWLMGWPQEWTDSKHWATVKFLSKPQSHGNCLEAAE
jgi:hypothetical protein